MWYFLFFAACLVVGTFSQRAQDLQEVSKDGGEKRVVCYYTNWSVYRKGLAKYEPGNVNPYLCTHLVYAFGGMTDEFEMSPFDSYQDIEHGGYAKFNGLKQYNKGLKTLLAVGGWNEGSSRFSELVSTPEFRQNFTTSAIKHLRRYKFDGLDLDWEYPGSREGSTPEDKPNYALFVQELREAFEKESARSSKPRLLLTMAVPAGQTTIDKGFDIPTLNRYLDFFNLLTYDYHSVFEPTANHHSALQSPPGTSEYEWDAQLNVDWTIKYYLKKGASKNKLVMGIPTYGRSYTLLDGQFHSFGSSADGPGVKGKYTNEKGYLAFYEICEAISVDGWQVKKPYPKRIGPIAFKGNQWVGYDDEKIVARKAEYVRDNGLGGIMFWTLDSDDFRGLCNGQQYPLIETAKAALYKVSENSVNEARALSPASVDSSVGNRFNSLSDRRNKRPQAVATTQSPSKRQRPGSVTIDPYNTPEPPTTPASVKGFQCKREGYQPNPDDCHKYFRCLDSGAAGLGIVAHTFSCPADLVFNKKLDGCDHPDSVKCKSNLSRGGAGGTEPTTTAIPRTTEFDYTLLQDYDYYAVGDYLYEEEPPIELEENVQSVIGDENGNVIRNSGGSQFQGQHTPEVVEEVILPVRETTKGTLGGGRTRPQYSGIQRDRSKQTIEEEPQEPVEDIRQPSRPNRPQYVTLNRQRPSPAEGTEPREEAEVLLEEVETVPQRGGLNYVTLSRQRPSTTEFLIVDEETTEAAVSDLKYVTVSRLRPSTTTELDSPFFNNYDTLDEEPEVAIETPEEIIVTEPPPTTQKPKIRIPTVAIRTINPRPPPSFRRRQQESTRGSQDVVEAKDAVQLETKIPPRRPGLRRNEAAAVPVTDRALRRRQRPTVEATVTVGSLPRVVEVIATEQPEPAVTIQPVQVEEVAKSKILEEDLGLSENVPQFKITEKSEVASKIQEPEETTQFIKEIEPTEGIPTVSSLGVSLLEETFNLFSQQDAKLPEKEEELKIKTPSTKSKESLAEDTLLLFAGAEEEEPIKEKEVFPKPEEISLSELENPVNEIIPDEKPALEKVETTTRSDSPSKEAFLLFSQQNKLRQKSTSSEDPGTRARSEDDTAVKEKLVTSTIPVDQPQQSLPRVTRPPLQFRPALRPRPVAGLEEERSLETSSRLSLTDILSNAAPSSVAPPPRNQRPTARPRPKLQPRPIGATTTEATTTTTSTTTPIPTATTLLPTIITTEASELEAHAELNLEEIREEPEIEVRPLLNFDEILLGTTTTPRPTRTVALVPTTTTTERSTTKLKPRLTARPLTTTSTPPAKPSSSLRPNRVTPETPPPTEYEYVYDYVDHEGALGGSLGQLATLTEKAVLLPGGAIECFDTGYFPHPESCKKFISCSKTVRGFLLGWTYTCPQELVFDPVGGMCNWTEAVDCQAHKN